MSYCTSKSQNKNKNERAADDAIDKADLTGASLSAGGAGQSISYGISI